MDEIIVNGLVAVGTAALTMLSTVGVAYVQRRRKETAVDEDTKRQIATFPDLLSAARYNGNGKAQADEMAQTRKMRSLVKRVRHEAMVEAKLEQLVDGQAEQAKRITSISDRVDFYQSAIVERMATHEANDAGSFARLETGLNQVLKDQQQRNSSDPGR